MSKELKIGLVLPSLPGYSETFIKNKIKGLLDNGCKVSLFVIGKENLNKIPESASIYYQVDINNKFNIFIMIINTFILYPVQFLRFLYLEMVSHGDWNKALKNLIINSHIIGKPLDWIHFCFATTSLGRENLALAMKIKSAVSFRGFDIGLYPHQHSGCYNLLWEKIDKVHAISDDLYQKAIDLGLDSITPYKKITPAINTEFFNSNVQANLHNPLRILTVGRLTWIKGYEYVLKALSLLQGKQINFEYHIVGEGNYREAILYAIHQLGLTDNIILRGQLSPEKVKDEMEWADIYIQPSIQEGFCNAVLEAQAMGLLCIVTNAEGLSENVLDGKTGWIIPKRNSNLIADKISDVLFMNSDERELISQQAKKRIMKKFDISKLNHSFNNFYKKIE